MKALPEYERLNNQYERWLEASSGWMKADLLAMGELSSDAFKRELYERFSVEAEFGTGGLRSRIRAGTNGINDFWIKRICKALRIDSSKIVIAYDTRKYSKEFAACAAETLSAGNVQVFLFNEPVPTPVLSFAVQTLHCDTGIVITASHNPKDYNGFKLYDANGVQYVPDKIKRLKAKMADITLLEKDEAQPQPHLIQPVSSEVYDRYFRSVYDELLPMSHGHPVESADMQIVYTPLHGTGAQFVPPIMTHFGVSVQTVDSQMLPDPYFSTVKVPNPEDPEAFALALERAEKMSRKPQALIATDPDADRLGMMVFTQKGYQALTGNELGVLLLDYILRKKGIEDYRERWAVLKTIVTTDAIKPMAQAYHLKIEETLTGFKYLGDLAVKLRKQGIDVLFSFEESFGYLFGSHSGDKDACSTSGLLTLLLLDCGGGEGVVQRLEQIRHKYGYYLEHLVTYSAEGVDGMNKLSAFMKDLRSHQSLKEWEEGVRMKDYLTEQSQLHSDVVSFLFSNGDKIIFRPSGTEPKVKAYINVHAQPLQSPGLDKSLADKRLEWMIGKVGELFQVNLN